MAVNITRAPAPIDTIVLASRRDGDEQRSIFVKCVGSSCVFTVTREKATIPFNIEVPKTEAHAFAIYLKEMCS